MARRGRAVIIRAQGTERGRLACWPRPYPQNPYLVRLSNALADEGVTTVSARYLAELVALPRGARWLHLHWPEWMLQDKSRARARARALWLFGLLDVARARGMRLAWTAHNFLGHDEPHPDIALRYRRALLSRCDVVLGHFPAAEGDVRDLGFRGRFALVPHPGYFEDYPSPPPRELARRDLGYTPEQTVLLAFGAIEHYKGLDRLAAAFVRWAPPSARLHVAGAPSSPAAHRSVLCAAGGDGRVRIEAGFVPPERAALLFAAADALVLSYRAFYTSGTAMLALTFGTPVLGPPTHHLATMCGEPFFVPMSTPEDLGSALEALARLDPRAREAAREFARARTWQGAARRVREALFSSQEAT